MLVGAHISAAAGLDKAVGVAAAIGADIFQFFSRNPRGGKARAISSGEVTRAREMAQTAGVHMWVGHAPYTINLCSTKPNIREFSINTLIDDLNRLEIMAAPYLIVHPGTHGGQGLIEGLILVREALGRILESSKSQTMLLLEVMAGEGSEIGADFEHFASLFAEIPGNERLGLCLDTCHLFGAGYRLDEPDQLVEVIDRTVGLERVRVMHVNDSAFGYQAHRDRHSLLGQGEIGLATLQRLLTHSFFSRIPLILETPGTVEDYAREIQLIKSFSLNP